MMAVSACHDKRAIAPALIFALCLLAAPMGGTAMAFTLSSPAFTAGAEIPKQHTCDGADLSPALTWSGAPPGSKSYTLIADDPDAPVGTWVHWVLYDLPAETMQ